jgi:hypothetical protein
MDYDTDMSANNSQNVPVSVSDGLCIAPVIPNGSNINSDISNGSNINSAIPDNSANDCFQNAFLSLMR